MALVAQRCINRRDLVSAGALLAGVRRSEASAPFPIIDTHIHLFDPTRPQGVPWPNKNNAVLYQPALPPRYRKLAAPHGITGAIEVECSPWLEDNQWVLDVLEKDKIMVGTIGDLEPGKPDFRRHLDRFHRNPMFLGIRCGTLWGRTFQTDVDRPEFAADMKYFAQAGLTMDCAPPTPDILAALVRLTDRVPDLRVVIDHLPQQEPPGGAELRGKWEADLRQLSLRPRIYLKISEVLRRVDGKVIEDLRFYRPRLDFLLGLFGEDRVVFGSDWPNSDNWAPYDSVFKVVYEYFMAKGRTAAEKYFWRNSAAAYRWVRRDGSQPDPKQAG